MKFRIMTLVACCMIPLMSSAKCGGVDYSLGSDALAAMHDFVVTLMLYVTWIVCTFATIISIISALQIYFKFNLGEQGITKSILTLLGAVLFILAAFKVLPAFYGYII